MKRLRFGKHYLVPLPLLVVGWLWYRQGYGEIRHLFSWVGVVYLGLAAVYLLRRRWLRWGRRSTWVDFHRAFALTGSAIILVHSALRPYSWHAAAALGLTSLAAGSGLWLSSRNAGGRERWRRLHLFLVPWLFLGVIAHGILRPRHEAFFPLAGPHEIACVRCHLGDRSYRTNGCLGCHPHDTPRIREAHELHGMREEEYRPCLDCHTATIGGIRYGRPRAPGHAEIPWK